MGAMSNAVVKEALASDYKHGFVTDIDMETLLPGLNEDVIRIISAKKNEPEFLGQERRLASLCCLKSQKLIDSHQLSMQEPSPSQAVLFYPQALSQEGEIIRLHRIYFPLLGFDNEMRWTRIWSSKILFLGFPVFIQSTIRVLIYTAVLVCLGL